MESNQMINQIKDLNKRLDKIEKIEKDLRDISDQLEAIKINMAPLSLMAINISQMATTINVSLPILVSSYQCANGFIEQNALDQVVLAADEYARKMEQINSTSEKE